MFDKLKKKVSNKSEEELVKEHVADTTDLYKPVEFDDKYFEERQEYRKKNKPFYDRLREKLKDG